MIAILTRDVSDIGNPRPKFDVGAAPGHVGSYRDRAALSRLHHDFRFPLMLFRIQYLVFQPPTPQHARHGLRNLDADGTHEYRLSELMERRNLVDYGVVLFTPRLIYHVVIIAPTHRLVGRYDRHFETVYLIELTLFRFRRSGHAGELVVHPEVVLDGYGGQRLGLPPDSDTFLGLDGLV